MLNLGSMYFQLGANTQGLYKAEREAAKFADRTEKKFDRVGRAARRLGFAIGAIVSVEGGRRLLMVADNFHLLQQRIKTATRATGGYNRVSRELLEISNRAGTALFDNVSLYQALARAAPELGAQSRELLTFTELVSQVGVIGGSDQMAMRNGMRQLVQGLSAGVFRAEEMNSILENIPELAFRIANGLGLSVGQMRRMVIDGKLLSHDVFRSLVKQAPQIAAQFTEIPRTITWSTQALRNSMSSFVGQWDKALGLTTGIAVSIQGMADFFGKDFSKPISQFREFTAQLKEAGGLWSDLWDDLKVGAGFERSNENRMTLADRELIIRNRDRAMAMELKKHRANERLKNLPGAGALEAENQIKFLKELPLHFRKLDAWMTKWFQKTWLEFSRWTNKIALGMAEAFTQIASIGLAAANAVLIGWGMMADGMILLFAGAIEKMAAMADNIPFVGDNFAGMADKAASLRAGATNEEEAKKNARARQDALRGLGSKLTGIAGDVDETTDAKLAALEARYQATLKYIEAQRESMAVAKQDRAQEEAAAAWREKMERISANFHPVKGQIGNAAPDNEKLVEATERRMRTLADNLSTETELEQRHYKQALDLLNQAEQLKVDAVLPYHVLRERLEKTHQDNLAKIRKEENKQAANDNAAAFKEQIAAAAQHSRSFFELNKAIAIATALIDAPKAVLSSYAYGAELGGPILGAAFAGIAAAATAVQVAAIHSAQYQGGRMAGGPTSAGGTYRVNESGQPELLSVGNKQVLMMGNTPGHVTPAHQIGGGGGEVTVNVFPQPGETASVKKRSTDNGIEIDVVIERMEANIARGIERGGSKIADTLENRYGLNRAAGAVS